MEKIQGPLSQHLPDEDLMVRSIDLFQAIHSWLTVTRFELSAAADAEAAAEEAAELGEGVSPYPPYCGLAKARMGSKARASTENIVSKLERDLWSPDES